MPTWRPPTSLGRSRGEIPSASAVTRAPGAQGATYTLRSTDMKTRHEILQKLAKWYQRAEEATSRDEVEKILRKVKKHARRLADLDSRYPYD